MRGVFETVMGRLLTGLMLAGCFTALISGEALCAEPAPAAPTATAPKAPPAPTKRDVSKPEQRVVLTKDQLPIAFTHWGIEGNPEAPVVILLHGRTGNRLDWPVEFLAQLHREGYVVVVPDLRGHGDSKGGEEAKARGATADLKRLESGKLKTSDYQAMVGQDLEAIKLFLFEEHQQRHLNMNRIGIVGAEVSANVAAVFAAFDWDKAPHEDGKAPDEFSPEDLRTPRGQDVRGVVLISPETQGAGLPVEKAIKMLREPRIGVAFLFCYGGTDKMDKGASKRLFEVSNPGDKYKSRMYIKEYPSPLRGTEMLGRGLDVEQNIVTFLDRHVRQTISKWRDRESKLGKASP